MIADGEIDVFEVGLGHHSSSFWQHIETKPSSPQFSNGSTNRDLPMMQSQAKLRSRD
jgi:hypothetical protein